VYTGRLKINILKISAENSSTIGKHMLVTFWFERSFAATHKILQSDVSFSSFESLTNMTKI
jgi:hypothetical protein